MSDPMDELIGRTLQDTFRLERLLGRGGMGAVFEARHLRTGRRYALKVLLPEMAARRDAVARFRREAEAVGALGHANVIAVHDFAEADGVAYLVMDLLEGEDLERRIERVGAMPVDGALAILRGMAAGLEAAHAVGLIHRDLKPANVFLATLPGAPERPVLLDFGLVKSFAVDGTALTVSGVVMGTPQYMSPEQASGRPLDARSDLYAFAAIAFELLTGRPPFVAPAIPALFAKLVSDPPPDARAFRPDLPGGLAAELQRALAKEPADRHASVEAFVSALDAAATGAWSGAPPSSPPTRAAAPATPQGNHAQSWPRGAVLGHDAGATGDAPTMATPAATAPAVIGRDAGVSGHAPTMATPAATAPATDRASSAAWSGPPMTSPAPARTKRSAAPVALLVFGVVGCMLTGAGIAGWAVVREARDTANAIDRVARQVPRPEDTDRVVRDVAEAQQRAREAREHVEAARAMAPLEPAEVAPAEVEPAEVEPVEVESPGAPSSAPEASDPRRRRHLPSAHAPPPPATGPVAPPAPLTPPAGGPSPDDPVVRATEFSRVQDYRGCIRVLRAARPQTMRVLSARLACAHSSGDRQEVSDVCDVLRREEPGSPLVNACHGY